MAYILDLKSSLAPDKDRVFQGLAHSADNRLSRSIDDTARIGKYLASPDGLLFIGKQIGLQRSNPYIQVDESAGIGGAVGRFLDKTIKEVPTRIWSPLNLLTQVAADGIGQHVNRHGLNPFNTLGFVDFQMDRVRSLEENADRLLELTSRVMTNRDEHIITSYSGGPKSLFGAGTTTNQRYEFSGQIRPRGLVRYVDARMGNYDYSWLQSNNLLKLTRSLDKTNPYAQQTSLDDTPDSYISNTIAENNSDWSKYNDLVRLTRRFQLKSTYKGPKIDGTPDTYVADKTAQNNTNWRETDDLIVLKRELEKDPNYVGPKIDDKLDDGYFGDKKTETLNNGNWTENNLLQQSVASHSLDLNSDPDTVKPLSNYLGKKKKISPSVLPDDNNGDGIKELLPFYTDNPNKPSANSKIKDVFGNSIGNLKDKLHDYGRFSIELIDNNNPNYSNIITFPIAVQGYTDNYTVNLKPIKYIGRGDTLNVYDGTERSISYTFKVVADNPDQLKAQYLKLNSLAAGMWPDYQTLLMRASLVKMTVGDLLVRQPGYMTSLTLTVPDEATWQINTGYAGGGGSKGTDYVLPMLMEVAINFVPIHTFLPQKSLSKSAFVLPPGSSWLTALSDLDSVPNKKAPAKNPVAPTKPVAKPKSTSTNVTTYKAKAATTVKPKKK